MGRKGRYETHVQPHLEEIREWYSVLSEKQIAERLGISSSSFEKYKGEHEELRAVLSAAKESLILDLKNTLKKKAQGFHYTETKKYIRTEGEKTFKVVEEYERYSIPDTGAIHLLLKNLDDTWRNDDLATINLKQQKLDLEKQRIEANDW